MRMKAYHFSLLTLVAASPVLAGGVRHSRTLGGTGQPIPRTQPAQPQPAVPNMNQGSPVPVLAPSQTPVQLPQQYPPGTQIPSPVAPPMPVQIPSQMGAPENPAGAVQPSMQSESAVPASATGTSGRGTQTKQNPQAQDPYIPPAPVVIPPPVPVQVPTQLQQSGAQQALPLPQAPIQLPMQPQPGLPSNTQALPLQGQPTLPPSPPGSLSGERYMMPTYGMAGCGLGSMIFTRNQRSEQWLAAIFNDGLFPQSFSISTGTSNCVDVDEEQSQAEQEIFIDSNFNALRIDAARGDGESLRAYAELLGCHKEGLYDTFASLSQGQFNFIFSDAQPRSVAERYRDSLKRSRALKTRCDRLF